MVYLYVKREGTAVSDAHNITYVKKQNSINYATFNIPDVDGTELNTWEDYINDDVAIYLSDDTLLWEGFIDSITENLNSLTISCQGSLAKLKRYVAGNAGDVNFVKDEGLVSEANDEVLTCVTDEEEAITWVADEWIEQPHYLIVDDSTLGTNTLTLENDGNGYVGFSDTTNADSETDDYTKVGMSPDADWWTPSFICNDTDYKNALINLDVANASYGINRIANTATIKKIRLVGNFSIVTGNFVSGLIDTYHTLKLVFGRDSGNFHTIKSFTYKFISGVRTEDYYFDFEYEVPSWFDALNIGDTYLEDGVVGFYFQNVNSGGDVTYVNIKWDNITVEIDYDTATFDGLNTLILDNDVNTLTVTEDLEALGVSPTDKWKIGVGVQAAYSSIFSGFPSVNIPDIPYVINNGADLGIGIAARYYGSDGYELWTNLADHFTLEYFEEINTTTTFFAKKITDFVDGGSLTGFAFENNLTTENNKYGTIIVVWKDGLAYKVNDEDNKNIHKEIRKDILTQKEAQDRANELATKYAALKRSFSLQWDSWKALYLGYVYDFTIAGTAYTDEICRSISVSQDGNDGAFSIVAEFGGGNTPPFEKTAREIGLLTRKTNKTDQLLLTSTYSSVTRHNQLNGIGTSDHHVKYTDAEAVSAMGAKADGNPLNHDIYTDGDAQSACIETVAITEDLTTKSPSSELVFDALAAKLAIANKYTDGEAVAAVETDLGQDLALLLKGLMIGSANKAYVPLELWGTQTPGQCTIDGTIVKNASTSNDSFIFKLAIPYQLNGLKLHVDGVKYNINAAAAGTDYVDVALVLGLAGTSGAAKNTDNTNRDSAAIVSYDITDFDASVYDNITLKLTYVVGTTGALHIGGTFLRCYYAVV